MLLTRYRVGPVGWAHHLECFPTKGGLEFTMTEMQEEQIIGEALEVIDGALNDFLHRELVSSNEITDILLDVRSLLRKGNDEVPAAT